MGSYLLAAAKAVVADVGNTDVLFEPGPLLGEEQMRSEEQGLERANEALGWLAREVGIAQRSDPERCRGLLEEAVDAFPQFDYDMDLPPGTPGSG